ncbi:centrosomal protein of 290 kDa-like [Salmo trutta]|uniref:centrosomal protein of 290 kDa-like n=1 Tax=Salmo trutta TaxID=8032 RepID=UPI001130C903|nr:centrosomal protein of 290 kDa-like [Salmo trutta]
MTHLLRTPKLIPIKLKRTQHFISVYYDDCSEKEAWQKERQTFTEMKNKVEEQKEVDVVKIKEFNHWLEALQKDPEELWRRQPGG